jgi:hypothetical protein
MASPVRFPKGLNTFPPKHILNTFPVAPSISQFTHYDDFVPYQSGKYTVTTAVAGTAASFAGLAGFVRLATSASATDTIYLSLNGQGFQLVPGSQAWHSVEYVYPRSVLNTNDTNIYCGWFDSQTPTLANNGVYFLKAAGGTSVNFIIRKNGVNTVFQNVADLALPSGLFGDSNSAPGTLNAVIAGTSFTGVSVATPGSGYYEAPLVLSTATAGGSVGSVPVAVGLGSSSLAGNPQRSVDTTGLTYGSLYAPRVTVPGTGFTNNAGAANLLEVEHIIGLQFYYDGLSDTFYVGINGRKVLSIGPNGANTAAAGGTVNVATLGPSFFSSTQISTALMPVQPKAGGASNILPMAPLFAVTGFANTTANIRSGFIQDFWMGCE